MLAVYSFRVTRPCAEPCRRIAGLCQCRVAAAAAGAGGHWQPKKSFRASLLLSSVQFHWQCNASAATGARTSQRSTARPPSRASKKCRPNSVFYLDFLKKRNADRVQKHVQQTEVNKRQNRKNTKPKPARATWRHAQLTTTAALSKSQNLTKCASVSCAGNDWANQSSSLRSTSSVSLSTEPSASLSDSLGE
jgi:hypothetical protein